MSGSISVTTLAYVSLAAAAAGTAVSAIGAEKQADAASSAANYNAQVAANNAAIATQSAQRAGAAGQAQVEQASLQNRAKIGGIVANQAAGGIDVNSGSALDVKSSARELGLLNALSVRSNAARTAYGYQTQAASESAEGTLDKFQAENATTAGHINAADTVLGGTSTAAGNYGRFLQQNSPLTTSGVTY